MSILLLPKDLKKEFEVDATGKAYTTKKGLARLCDVEPKSIRELLKRIQGGTVKPQKLFKPFVGQDFSGGTKVPDILAALVIKYYAEYADERYRTEQAQDFSLAIAAVGFRVWVQDQLGWQKQPQQKQVKPHYIRRVEELMEQLPSVPDGYWCVLHKSVDVLFYVEHCLQMPINQTDLLDGSIGRKWSDYRKGKEWAGDRVPFQYRFPDGRKVNPWCYGLHELGYFAQWLEQEYRRQHLPKYLKAKYGAIVKV